VRDGETLYSFFLGGAADFLCGLLIFFQIRLPLLACLRKGLLTWGDDEQPPLLLPLTCLGTTRSHRCSCRSLAFEKVFLTWGDDAQPPLLLPLACLRKGLLTWGDDAQPPLLLPLACLRKGLLTWGAVAKKTHKATGFFVIW
jgi:hypothetical protein